MLRSFTSFLVFNMISCRKLILEFLLNHWIFNHITLIPFYVERRNDFALCKKGYMLRLKEQHNCKIHMYHSRKRYSRENVQFSLNHSSLVTNVILQFQPNERNIACPIKVQPSCSHFLCLSYDKFCNIKVKISFIRLIIVPPKYLDTFFRKELENASNGI